MTTFFGHMTTITGSNESKRPLFLDETGKNENSRPILVVICPVLVGVYPILVVV